MSRLLIALGAPVIAMGILAAPGSAQRSQIEVVVYGDDPCPRAAEDEVVVCRRRPEEERFRIPEELRATERATDPANQAWSTRVQYLDEINTTGIRQCSAIGPAQTGCLQEQIDEARARREAIDEDETAPDQ